MYIALRNCKFKVPTKIQCGAIPHALVDRDILAAAKTGSGKTLGTSFYLKREIERRC